MQNNTNQTIIYLAKSEEDIQLLNDIESLEKKLKLSPKEFIQKYPVLYRLKQNLKSIIEQEFV